MQKPFNEFQFAPIQFHSTKTGEVFNIGVVMTDDSGQNAKIKTIDSFSDIAKCLKIKNPSGHDFVLEMLHKNFNDNKIQFGKEYSNAIKIEKLDWYNSNNSLEEEIEIAFNDFVTLSHAHQLKNTIGEYTNTKIITKISNIAKEKGMKNIAFRKKNLAHKQIDTVTFGEKNKIIVAGEVCSPHMDDFMEHFANSSFALDQAKTTHQILALIMYLPIMEDITSHVLRKNYDFAEGYSRERGYVVEKSKYHEAYLDSIADLTKKNGGDLFSNLK